MHIQTVSIVLAFATELAKVHKHCREMNTFHMIDYIGFLSIRFSTNSANKDLFVMKDLLVDILVKDSPIRLTRRIT